MPCPGPEPGTSRLWSECVIVWSILPNEKLRKNKDNIYLICCSTNVCQFDIPLQHCSIHIITHYWTPQAGQFGQLRVDSIVWSTVMSSWTKNVRQFDCSLWYAYATIKLVSPDKLLLLRDRSVDSIEILSCRQTSFESFYEVRLQAWSI